MSSGSAGVVDVDKRGREDEVYDLHVCSAKCMLSPIETQKGDEGAGGS